MREDCRRALSLLADGECSGARMHGAIDRLIADADMKELWERYHLIGQVLRREQVQLQLRPIADRVGAVVYRDLRALAPPKPRSRRRQVVAPLALALAAGTAMLAVFVLPEITRTSGNPDVAVGGDRPIAAANDQRWRRDDPLVRARLNQLVVEHQERAPSSGLAGVVSYAAVVGYEGRP